jgi:hypothetical protein
MVKLLDKKPYDLIFPEQEYEKKEETIPLSPKPKIPEYEEREQPREVTIERRTIHKMLREQEELEPLRQVSPKIIGNLFDRVEFLSKRINETKLALETREKLHEELMHEIESDIRDKESTLKGLSDIDDVRDFKLDISTLRMEKRRECVQFWRDVLQLSTELRELMEKHETELKIANLFRDLQPGV